jgi:hypothetical protein
MSRKKAREGTKAFCEFSRRFVAMIDVSIDPASTRIPPVLPAPARGL